MSVGISPISADPSVAPSTRFPAPSTADEATSPTFCAADEAVAKPA